MITWVHITLVIAFASLLILFFLFILRRCFRPKTRTNTVLSNSESGRNFQNGLSRLHQISSKKTNKYNVLRRELESELIFSWADHPNLIADAVENGWSRFAFRTSMSSPAVEIGWEGSGGGDFVMQKIRFNRGLEKVIPAVDSPVIRTGLPLPGPRFGNSYFPQEAYFEITILPNQDRLEGEKIKLIEDGKTEIIWMSVGLTGNGGHPSKIPGSFRGSVGFNSNGSVYLNGTKLVLGSAKDEWARKTEKVVGCGYKPGEKTIFFTVDSQLVHEIHCKTEEFGHPLYPTLAANTDVMVLFNLGQSPFKFAPGNLQRTPNPCFIGPASQPNSPYLGCINEDSKDLFSMGRIDSRWTTINYNSVNSVKSLEYDQESESDLFEIVLDSMGRSPYSTTY